MSDDTGPSAEEVVEQVKKRVPISPEWVWRVLAAALLIANLWLNQNYVTRKEYDPKTSKLEEAIQGIRETLAEMRQANQINKDQNDSLVALEGRIRSLEINVASIRSGRPPRPPFEP